VRGRKKEWRGLGKGAAGGVSQFISQAEEDGLAEKGQKGAVKVSDFGPLSRSPSPERGLP